MRHHSLLHILGSPLIGPYSTVPETEPLGGPTVGYSDEPPALPGRLEVPGPPAPVERGVVHGHRVLLAPGVHYIRGQVDKLVVLHLHR